MYMLDNYAKSCLNQIWNYIAPSVFNLQKIHYRYFSTLLKDKVVIFTYVWFLFEMSHN